MQDLLNNLYIGRSSLKRCKYGETWLCMEVLFRQNFHVNGQSRSEPFKIGYKREVPDFYVNVKQIMNQDKWKRKCYSYFIGAVASELKWRESTFLLSFTY